MLQLYSNRGLKSQKLQGKNLVFVDKKMQMTFALRRNEIITSPSPVKEILGHQLWQDQLYVWNHRYN